MFVLNTYLINDKNRRTPSVQFGLAPFCNKIVMTSMLPS